MALAPNQDLQRLISKSKPLQLRASHESSWRCIWRIYTLIVIYTYIQNYTHPQRRNTIFQQRAHIMMHQVGSDGAPACSRFTNLPRQWLCSSAPTRSDQLPKSDGGSQWFMMHQSQQGTGYRFYSQQTIGSWGLLVVLVHLGWEHQPRSRFLLLPRNLSTHVGLPVLSHQLAVGRHRTVMVEGGQTTIDAIAAGSHTLRSPSTFIDRFGD